MRTEPSPRELCTAHHGVPCIPWPTGTTDAYRLYFEGDALYDDMIRAIGAARERVSLETYIYSADEVGWRIGEALAESARAGVAVRLRVDAAGSRSVFSKKLVKFLRQAGVTVRHFHRWDWRQPLRYYRRNHRKLLVIDDQEAFVGGFNIHRESSQLAMAQFSWRDTHVQLTGALARDARALFDTFWRGDRSWSRDAARVGGDVLVPNHSRVCRHQVHCLYLRLLRAAQSHVYLTTPYFVPDRSTQRELIAVAARGVDVRLLLPGKTDVPIARWAARAAYSTLLAGGVRIFEYQPRVLHAKTAVVDGAFATVGTANLDYRSFFINDELNLFSSTRTLCMALEAQFLVDVEDSIEVTRSQWSTRASINLATEAIGWFARRWL